MPDGLSKYFRDGFVDISMRRLVGDGSCDMVEAPFENKRVVHNSATFEKLAGKRYKVDELFLEDLVKSASDRYPGLENEHKFAALANLVGQFDL